MEHTHSHTPARFNSAFAIAVTLNLAYTLLQALFALYAHSMGLLADAGHNLGDVLSLLLAWGATWLLTRPPTERYSYGHKRSTILTAVFNSAFLIAICLFIVYESARRLLHPEPVLSGTVLVVALIGIVVNAGTALLFVREAKEDLNIKGAFMHLAADALVSLGVVIAALLMLWTHYAWIDPVAGIIIALLIIYSTKTLLTDSINLMLDGVPRHINIQRVKHYLENLTGVTAVHDLHVWGLSTREIAMTAHLIMPVHELSDKAHHDIRCYLHQHFHIHHVTLQVEKGDLTHPCTAECNNT